MCPPPITLTWPCCGLLCARTITSDETALQRDLHSHSQSSSPTRLRGSSDMNSEWKVVSWTSAPCSVWNQRNGLGAPHGPVVDRSIGYAVQFSNSSHSRDSPHTLACGPDASESASKSECPRILYQVSFYVEDALSVDAVSRGRAPAGEPERTPGTTRAPGGTRRGTIHGTACCLSCLITHVDGAARSTVNVSSCCQLTHI